MLSMLQPFAYFANVVLCFSVCLFHFKVIYYKGHVKNTWRTFFSQILWTIFRYMDLICIYVRYLQEWQSSCMNVKDLMALSMMFHGVLHRADVSGALPWKLYINYTSMNQKLLRANRRLAQVSSLFHCTPNLRSGFHQL